MALSPADFAAYSRATGTPYPEDPEERAALAPQVLEFRRSQLQAPQQESNLPGILGAAALGLGAIAGGVGLARALGGKRAQVAASKIPEQNLAGVRNLGAIDRQRAAEETVRQARAERIPGVVQADLSSVDRLLQDPELLSLVQKQSQEELSEARSFQSKAQAEYRNLISSVADDIIAQERASEQVALAKQTIGALESGEDQITGRTMRGVQRNEDLDIAGINNLAVQIGDVNVAASMIPDGTPADQVELLQPITAQELANQAKDEMIARRQSLEAAGLRPGTVRFERALAQPFRTSSTQQVTGTEPIEFALPAGPIRRTVEAVGAQEPLIENAVLNIGPQAVVTSTAAGTSIRGAAPTYHIVEKQEPTRQIFGTPDVLVPGAPDELMPDYPGKYTAMHQLLTQSQLPERIDPFAVKRLQGGSAGIGVYGVEQSYVPGAVSKTTGEYSQAASRQPSYVPGWLQKRESKTGFESLTTPQLVAGAEAAKAPSIKASFEQELGKRETTKQSLEVSEIARRAIIEGRDPQMILRQRGFNV